MAVELTVLDFAPNVKETKPAAALDPDLLPLVRDLEALLLVVPTFAGPESEAALLAALDRIEGELVFADFEQAERRMERLRKEKADSDFERAALRRCLDWLEQGRPLRTVDLSAQERQTFASFGFLSRKPALVVINCEVERAAAGLSEAQERALGAHGVEAFRLAAAFEAELWDLDQNGRAELLREARLEAPARDRLVAALYRRLGLLTFYTAREPEARAWSLSRGATALEAAARVHTDIAHGFIRAEVMSFEDFAALGSEARVRDAGKLRLEGRDYIVRDGDIIRIRFKV